MNEELVETQIELTNHKLKVNDSFAMESIAVPKTQQLNQKLEKRKKQSRERNQTRYKTDPFYRFHVSAVNKKYYWQHRDKTKAKYRIKVLKDLQLKKKYYQTCIDNLISKVNFNNQVNAFELTEKFKETDLNVNDADDAELERRVYIEKLKNKKLKVYLKCLEDVNENEVSKKKFEDLMNIENHSNRINDGLLHQSHSTQVNAFKQISDFYFSKEQKALSDAMNKLLHDQLETNLFEKSMAYSDSLSKSSGSTLREILEENNFVMLDSL